MSRAANRSSLRLGSLLALIVLPGGITACDTGSWCERFKLDCDARGDVVVPEVEDLDFDGFGAAEDCNDTNSTIHPLAEEVCDGLDNNCDDQVDEGTPGIRSWFRDADADGYGDDASEIKSCEGPIGHVVVGGDCDDNDRFTWPGAEERCDLVDNDCDDEVDEGLGEASMQFPDGDGDGYGRSTEGNTQCGTSAGWAAVAGDCRDDDPEVHPGAVEVCDNGVDDDCDGGAGSCSMRSFRSISPEDGLLLLTSAEAPVGRVLVELLPPRAARMVAFGASELSGGGEVYVIDPTTFDPRSGAEPERRVLRIGEEGARLGAALSSTHLYLDERPLLGIGAPGLDLGAIDGGAVLLGEASGAGQSTVDDYAGCVVGLDEGMGLGSTVISLEDAKERALTLAAGAPGAADGRGAVFLFDGTQRETATSTDDAVSILHGPSTQLDFGAILAGGDVDGDGVADLLGGALPSATSSPALQLFFDFELAEERWADIEATQIRPQAETDRLAEALWMEHDLDEDGVNDLILGAPGVGAGAGAVWVLAGGIDLGERLLGHGLEGAMARLEGSTPGGGLGTSLTVGRLEDVDTGNLWLVVGVPGDGDGVPSPALTFFEAPLSGVIGQEEADGGVEMEEGLGLGSRGTLLSIRRQPTGQRDQLLLGLPASGAGDVLLLDIPTL